MKKRVVGLADLNGIVNFPYFFLILHYIHKSLEELALPPLQHQEI